MKIKGKVWKFGDNIDTDVIIPARYLNTTDERELAKHCMEDIDPEFAKKVQPGDIIVAGESFGIGSSREHAPLAIKSSGVALVIAKSFARIFYRNSINIGLPILENEEVYDLVETGDEIEVDLDKGEIIVGDKKLKARPFPEFVKEIINYGGLLNYAKEKYL